MPFFVVAKDNPFLGTDYRQPSIVFHILRESIRWTMVVFDVEGSLHLKQRLGEARAKTTIKIERY